MTGTNDTTARPAPSPRADSLESRLADVRVGVRRDLVVTRQFVRQSPRYVLHDPVGFRNHILSPLEYRILCSIVSHQTLGELLERLVANGTLDADDTEDYYRFVANLHGMGLLIVPGMPVDGIWARHLERQQARRGPRLRALLSWRVPLGDPDRWLERTLPFVRWLFTRSGFLLWVALLAAALWQCGGRLGELYGDAAGLLALHNLPLLWCALVGLKALHELGHGYAIKRYGGTVPDFGVVFIMLTPCAYVDANASWTFSGRWPRVVVGMGGMYVESMVAAVFALIWAGTGDGLLHEFAHNVVVLATATTVLININPLIKFDGYYVLSDLLGAVNLQERATRYLRGLAEWIFLGLPRPDDEHTRSERVLIWLYAPAALAYRILLAFWITGLMLTQWPAVGVMLGLAFGWLLIGQPLWRLFAYLWRGERSATVRLRARCVAVGAVVVALLAATLAPVSRAVFAPGVLDPGVRRSIRAPNSSYLETLHVRDGDHVDRGAVVCQLRDPLIEERRITTQSELDALQAQFDATELTEPTLAASAAARIDYLRKRVAELDAQAAALSVTVPDDGTVVGSRGLRPGQFVRRGDELLQLHSEHRFVRIVLTDQQITRTRLDIGSEVQLRWTCAPGRATRAVVCEIRRSASRRHVPIELTVAGGGEIIARADGSEIEATQPYLHVFLIADDAPLEHVGSGLTATVRIPASSETLGEWATRSLLNFLHHWRMS